MHLFWTSGVELLPLLSDLCRKVVTSHVVSSYNFPAEDRGHVQKDIRSYQAE
jgi:hypothetical protein